MLELYRLVDWLLGLPENLQRDFRRQVANDEASKNMPYVTSIERMAREEGLNEGRAHGVTDMLVRQLRRGWPSMSSEMEGRIRALPGAELDNLALALLDFSSLAELESWLASR